MTNEQLNTALYEKLTEQQERFRGWLLSQPPEEILNHAYEYTVREDILLSLEYNDLNDEQASALLEDRNGMESLFTAVAKAETGYMDTVLACIENRADEAVKARQAMCRCPVYLHSAAYAREHGELDAYRSSRKANIACKEAVEAAVREHYSNNTLNPEAVSQVLAQFGPERTAHVLAVTVRQKDWDQRISRDNKDWAGTIPVAEDKDHFGGDRNTELVVDQCHPGLVDLFVTQLRRELQKEKTVHHEKRPSVLDQLRKPIPETAALPKQKEPVL